MVLFVVCSIDWVLKALYRFSVNVYLSKGHLCCWKDLYLAVIGWSFLKTIITSNSLMMLFKSIIFLLIFCLFLVSKFRREGVLKLLNIIVDLIMTFSLIYIIIVFSGISWSLLINWWLNFFFIIKWSSLFLIIFFLWNLCLHRVVTCGILMLLVLEKKVYFAFVGWSVLQISIC